LKKQSQFVGGQIGASLCLKGDYEEIILIWTEKTKPNKANMKFNVPGSGFKVYRWVV